MLAEQAVVRLFIALPDAREELPVVHIQIQYY